jgi:hypothetical protein
MTAFTGFAISLKIQDLEKEADLLCLSFLDIKHVRQ